MNEFKYAFRRFFRGGSLNIIKIISLGLGFAISFILLSKVAYELSFDKWMPDSERLYRIANDFESAGEKKEFHQVSGAVAPGMKKELPQVEAATRWTSIDEESTLYLEDDRPIAFEAAFLADDCFFDIFATTILSGDPKQALTQKMTCMVSDAIAKKIGGEVIGKEIRLKSYPDKILSIGGVFKEIPANSSWRPDVLISMASIGEFTWDGSENWLGNDRYIGMVKLSKGTNPQSLTAGIRQMQVKYQDIEKLEKEYNAHFTYFLEPLGSIHFSDSLVKTSVLLIGIIGLIVLVMSLLNYLLLRITTIINAGKNTGIRKCFGAESSDIRRGIFADTLIHLLFALLFGGLFLLVFRKTLGSVLDLSLSEILTPYSLLIVILLLLLSGLFVSFGPGRMAARQSLIRSIRDNQETKNRWKMALLFVEGLGVTFLLSTVFFVHKQYNHSMNIDKGFDVTNVYSVPTASIDSLGLKNTLLRMENMPEVELASLAFTVPFSAYQSGDNVIDPETGKDIRNVSDYFWVDEHYLELFKIPIVQGEGFDTAPCHSKNALVNETFARHLVEDFGWTDGVVGKQINVTSHDNPMTIVGVFKDFRSGRFGKPFLKDESIVLAGGAWWRFNEVLLLRLKDSDPATIKTVEDIINEYSAFGDVKLISAEEKTRDLFMSIRNLGHYTLFGLVIAIVIALIGIIGYTEEEVARRRKEIAIRKVNGAGFGDILSLFVRRYLKVGIPATLLGLVLSFLAIQKWVETLTDPTTLPVFAFFLIGLCVLLVTCLIMAVYCYFTANSNPTLYLSEE